MRGYIEHAPVCNSCGTNELSADVKSCKHCPTLICRRCRANHESVCENNQQRKRKGLGRTVRTAMDEQIADVLNVPPPPQAVQDYVAPTTTTVDQGLAGLADLLKE